MFSLSLENPNSVLTFVTLSGELKTRQEKDHIVLDLPLYSTYPQVRQGFVHKRFSRKASICLYVCLDTYLPIFTWVDRYM